MKVYPIEHSDGSWRTLKKRIYSCKECPHATVHEECPEGVIICTAMHYSKETTFELPPIGKFPLSCPLDM